jgi:PAS domain S-box-containing protein
MTDRDECHEAEADLRILRLRVAELENELGAQVKELHVLRESEHNFRTLLENAPDSITVMTPECELLYVNRVPAPRKVSDAIGTNVSAYMPHGEAKRFRDAVRAALESGKPQMIEVRTAGDQQWETTLVPLNQGTPTAAVMGIGADVTARRRLEEQLRQAQKMEAVGQLTAGLAHNFNNLLAAIIPSVQLARRDPAGDADCHLRDAEYAALRAAELVRELVLFAHPRKNVAKAPVDVARLLRRSVDICRALFDRSIEITFTGGEVPAAIGETGQLEQVFMNICLNARDALEAVQRADRAIRVAIDLAPAQRGDAAEWLRVRIEDNGTGMPAEVRTRVFEPFFTTKEVGHGSGLGLATAYSIVRDHGGQILCESTPGVGTTFTVFLPAIQAPAAASSAPKPAPRGGTETILIIDDEELVRSAVRSVLEREGYAVLEAADGAEGLQALRREREKIAITLLDFSMPGMRGEDVLREILKEDPKARVVAFTGYPPANAPPGLLSILEKPVELDALLRVVRDLCDA